jgi:hypothetical protein
MIDVRSEQRPIDFATEGLRRAHRVGRNCGIGFMQDLKNLDSILRNIVENAIIRTRKRKVASCLPRNRLIEP